MLEIFLIGAIIVIGFFAYYLFERTKIPEVLLLIFVGVLLGPVFHVVDSAYLAPLAPFFGALALVIILFDGGLNLNIFKVLGGLGPSSLFTVLSFTLVVAAITASLCLLFGWNVLFAMLVGIILGGTASNFIIPVVSRMNVSGEIKTILSLESALNDTLTIVGAIALTGVIATHSFDLQSVSNRVLGAFAIAGVLGVIAGIAWLKVMTFFKEKAFGYMLTLAVVFMLYAGVESVQANGAISVLVFGLIMGGSRHIQVFLDGKAKPVELEGPLKTFHMEIAFFVRTFFFVYLGVILNLKLITASAAGVAGVVFLALLVGRFVSVRAFGMLYPRIRPYSSLMTVMVPRGLAAAVLASLPASQGVHVPLLEETVLTVLILTNLLATFGVFYFERTTGRLRPVPQASSSSSSSRPPVGRPKVVFKR